MAAAVGQTKEQTDGRQQTAVRSRTTDERQQHGYRGRL